MGTFRTKKWIVGYELYLHFQKESQINDKVRNSFIGVQPKCKGYGEMQEENRKERKGYGSKYYRHE